MAGKVKGHIRGDSWERHYRQYQSRLAGEYLVPLLRSWGVEVAGKAVLEVGSGNGGCGEVFALLGSNVTAVEIDGRLVEVSRRLNEEAGIDIDVHEGDVCDPRCRAYAKGPFDLALVRDVMEHLEDPRAALGNIARNLAPEGKILVVFPPYYSPYGAHQQILKRRTFLHVPYNKLPYIQLLPDTLFSRIVGVSLRPDKDAGVAGDRSGAGSAHALAAPNGRADEGRHVGRPDAGSRPSVWTPSVGGDKQRSDRTDALFGISADEKQAREVARLRRIRLSMARFEREVSEVGLSISKRKFYISRPTFALRYGLPVIAAGPLGRIPIVRELVVTGAFYLLERDGR